MSNITTEQPVESLLVLQSLLDGLLQWLEPNVEEGRDPINLDPLLDEALSQSANAKLHGVTELLRIWSAAMNHRARLGAMFSEQEKASLHAWFSELHLYCLGCLDRAGQLALLEQLAHMPKLSKLPPRLTAYLEEKLVLTEIYIQELLADDSAYVGAGSDSPAFAGSDNNAFMANEPDAFAMQNNDALIANEPDAFAISDDNAFMANEPDAFAMQNNDALIANEPDAFAISDDNAFMADEPDAFVMQNNDALIANEPDAFAISDSDAFVSNESNTSEAMHSESQALELQATDPTLLIDTNNSFNTAGDDSDSTIWISAEELALALDAVGNQILPLIYLLAEEQNADDRQTTLGDLEFNLGLVGNAMEMLGTPALSQGILVVQDCVSSSTPPAADTLVNWSACLVAYLEEPNPENAELLGLLGGEIEGLDESWTATLIVEASRIKVGMDPALLASRKTLALEEDVALDVASDVLPNVLDGMLRELPGNAERLGNAVRRLVATGDTAPIDEARRVAHTLKGDANTVGIRGLANLTHSLEDLLIELYKHPDRLVPELGNVLDRAADCVEEIADYLLGRGPLPDNLHGVYQSILDWSNAVVTDSLPAPEIHTRRLATRADDAPIATTASAETMQPVIAATEEPGQNRTATLTVSAELLDELQRLAGETLVMARQIDQRLSLLETMHREQVAEGRQSTNLLGKLDDLITLRGAALQSTALRGGTDIDPLELDQYNELHVVSRRLLESNADSNDYQRRLDSLIVELDSLRSDQETVHADLQRMVQRARTVPFDQISGRVQRIVRQTARQLDREVDLNIVGEQTLLDADLLDRVVEPLAHLLRNAIDHGLEDRDEREFAGKSNVGQIKLSVSTVADSIEIKVEDDGRGLDYDAIRRKAIHLGMATEDRVLSDAELSRLILAPGFTTRQQATQVSGRGIGMDVVNQRIIDLRGQLSLSSVSGKGMTITMRLPVSQTVANVIISHGHGLILGAVAGSVERVHNFTADELIISNDGQMRLSIDGDLVDVYPVETLYGRNEGRMSIPTSNGLGLLVRSPRGKHVLISVGSISDVSSVIVKPISPFLPPIASVRGMTLLGDGRLAAVVDVGTLVDALDEDTQAWRIIDSSNSQVSLPHVVVADDSLSVRRAMTQLMEDAGYEVSAARDGLEALDLINAKQPALVLLDLEMPKLNGLEVTRFMRSRAQTRNVPVLMITSRASEKYRIQAAEAGVTLMLGKPVSEDELIATVRDLMTKTYTEATLEHS